jgi:hypothetical protein
VATGDDAGAASTGVFTRSVTISCAGACGAARFFAFDGTNVVMTDTRSTFTASPITGVATPAPAGSFPTSIPQGGAACVVGSSLFLLGGGGDGVTGAFTDAHWRAQDLATGAWTTGASSWAPHDSPLVAVNGGCVSVGGQLQEQSDDGSTAVESFAPASQTWTALAAMPMPVMQSAIAYDGARLFVAGGQCYLATGCPTSATQTFFSAAWVSDLTQASPTWTAAPDMPSSRINGLAVAYDGRFYVLGGTVDDTGQGALPATVSWAIGESAWTTHGPAAAVPIVAAYADAVGIFALTPTSSGDLQVLRWQP